MQRQNEKYKEEQRKIEEKQEKQRQIEKDEQKNPSKQILGNQEI